MLSVMMFPMEQGFPIIMRKIWNLAMSMTLALLLIGLFDHVLQPRKRQ